MRGFLRIHIGANTPTPTLQRRNAETIYITNTTYLYIPTLPIACWTQKCDNRGGLDNSMGVIYFQWWVTNWRSQMSVTEACEHAGVSSLQLFKDAYARYGLVVSIGNADTTHRSWELHGAVPWFVTRFIQDVARKPRCPERVA